MIGKLMTCLIIGTLTTHLCLAANEKLEKIKANNSDTSSVVAAAKLTASAAAAAPSAASSQSAAVDQPKTKDTAVDKRQVDRQTSINPQDQSDLIFKSPNHFVVRAIGYNNRIESNRRLHTNGGGSGGAGNNNNNNNGNSLQQQYAAAAQALAREQQVQANQAEEQSLEDALQQQYGFFHEVQQPTHRFQTYRPLGDQFKPLLQKSYHPRLAQYIPQPQQLIQAQPLIQSQSSAAAQNQPEIPQYAPHPYPIVQEDQLLKFLEDELASKGITATPQPAKHVKQAIVLQARPQQQQQQQHQHQQHQHQQAAQAQHQQQLQQQHLHSVQQAQKPQGKYKSAGLGSYKQQVPQAENIQYIYVPQSAEPQQQHIHQHQAQQQQQHIIHQQQAHHHHHHPGPQQLIETPPPPQFFVQQQEAAPITYQSKSPNSQQQAQQQQNTHEKEYEKLYAVSKQTDTQPQYALIQPQPQAAKAPLKLVSKPQSGSDKEYSFLPSLAQFSGFLHQGKSQKPSAEKLQSSRQYLPKVNYNHGQYLVETLVPNKQSKYKESNLNSGLVSIQSSNNNLQTNLKPQSTSVQYYTTNPQKSKGHNPFIPIVHNTMSASKKENAMKLIEAPALQYEKPEPQQQQQQVQQHYYSGPVAQHSEQVVTPAAPPSVSTIYVSQGTGVEPTRKPNKHSQHLSLHAAKSYKEEKRPDVKLPPLDGKPISQEEFQALVDAGYPVQAVPIPVPVPYDEYIKSHPEYKYEQDKKQADSQRQQQQQHEQEHHHQHHQHHQHQQHQQQQQQQAEASESNLYSSQANGVTYQRSLPQRHRRFNAETSSGNDGSKKDK